MMIINQDQSVKFKIVSSLSMIGVVFIHAKFIMSRWGETMQTDSFWSILSSATQYLISEQITRVCVPIFFLISGFFFFLKYDGSLTSFYGLIKKRSHSILIPYFFWSILWFLIYQILNGNIAESFFVNLYESLINPIPYQFWFLQILMICFLLAPIIYFLIKKTGFVFFVVVIGIYFLDYVNFKSDAHGLLFFALGAYLGQQERIKEILNKKLNFTVYVILIVVGEALFLSTSENFITVWILIHKLMIIFSLIIILNYIFFQKIKYNQFVNFVTKINTSFFFFLFVSHEPMLSFLKRIWLQLLGSQYNLLAYFLLPAFLIVITYFVYIFMKKKCNAFLSIITGGR